MSGLGPAGWAGVAASWAAVVPSGARWLRVAQREHYLAGSTSRFALRWWTSSPPNALLALVALVAWGLSWEWPVAALGAAAVGTLGPLGLGLRGRTGRLGLTRRLRTLAVGWLVLEAGVAAAGFALGRPGFVSVAALVLVPLLVDLALAAAAPLERHLAGRYVAAAAKRLGRVRPLIVGITGSYGKTSTKNYVAHLVAKSRTVVATPASFNNRAGLARAINEGLVEGTQIFVAEMGTYGPGEIAELCRWCPPQVAVMTAIGPVHLERFGSEEAIVTAKREITGPATTVVLNVDDPRLARLAEELAAGPGARRVLRCSATDRSADVALVRGDDGPTLWVGGVAVASGLRPPEGAQPTNVACALGVAVAIGLPPGEVVGRIDDLPTVAHRLSVGQSASGVWVVDDTFNANPAGVRAALRVLAELPVTGRRVVVTPGMVELGRRQAAENTSFAEAALAVADELVVVGRTNRRALLAGAGGHQPVVVTTREEAVAWVRRELGPGDAVLYENDLPDHYP
jgi:UDP-N-acetylmuramoyl-tripeptide--D-alanyl-D-alanine ligase